MVFHDTDPTQRQERSRAPEAQHSAPKPKGELDMAEATWNQPIGHRGTAHETAAAVFWRCSPGASFIVGVALPSTAAWACCDRATAAGRREPLAPRAVAQTRGTPSLGASYE